MDPATPEDKPFLTKAIRGVSLRSRLGGIGVLVADQPSGWGPREKAIAEWHLTDPDAFAYVCWEENIPIGCLFGHVGLTSIPWSERVVGHVTVCWVEPDYRRQGIANRLVAAAEGEVRARGLKTIELAYTANNQEAEGTWTESGYVPFRIYASKDLS